MNETLFDALYIAHAGIIWTGSIREIAHIYKKRSARDITKFWIVCLLMAEMLALPRALTSGYAVWGICHIVSACLIAVLLVGVWRFGR